MENETGCETPQGPILCANKCGFFGTAAMMNMCSKCYKDIVLKQQQTDLAASSIKNIVNGVITKSAEATSSSLVVKPTTQEACVALSSEDDPKNNGPNRCNTCRKKVGLTGFSCRCGHVFCSMHRYSEKHDCTFDYRSVGRDAIAKANPIVKAEKLDKI